MQINNIQNNYVLDPGSGSKTFELKFCLWVIVGRLSVGGSQAKTLSQLVMIIVVKF